MTPSYIYIYIYAQLLSLKCTDYNAQRISTIKAAIYTFQTRLDKIPNDPLFVADNMMEP